MAPMTTWVKRLLIANIVMYFVSTSVPMVYGLLVLYQPQVLVRPWSLVTYMFLHGGMGHLIFNMIGLYFFGPRLESKLGEKGFLWLYFLSGIGGAIFYLIFSGGTPVPVVGASAGVYGILLGFAMYWPREKIYLWMILPVEAWLLAAILVVASLYSGINPSAGSNTAHFAHLGGIVFAFAFLKWWDWNKGAAQRSFQSKLNPNATPTGMVGDKIAMARWKGISVESLHELNRGEVVRIMTKVEGDGAASLSASERQFLDRMSDG
jgi:membrane associated rhomboid family serine protease